MTVVDFAFYLFAIVTVTAGLMVTVARNPVHSVLWLILTFFSAAGLMVLLGAEFVAMLLLIVYVGAVAVLFLFVVMMLDIDFAALKGEMARYMPLGLLIGLVLIMQLMIGLGFWGETERSTALDGVDNARALGMILYDKYIYLFQASAMVLLVAMIGAILLTLRHRKDVKRQNVLQQMWRDPAKQLELKDVKPGQGL
ncbi:NADH-quinone oxidoreductase subunit J [Xinfangfangia sp. CPCC 101601]|uniref:NADH-quinone oxidoreductase subunit J n=1 Tax=Pseudogemmobacter lacusdianii TaxID=3069608 RepID=A0ABU0VY52_9RHOB|nr:NADH-quinone oxidoreductase subunit J [Xinfangfangia sp. CPCC 101601]MDQ2066662.1 NADH-quinone oxidoreductase subunit J [Xinfangfangia sp. CPCC 101601]